MPGLIKDYIMFVVISQYLPTKELFGSGNQLVTFRTYNKRGGIAHGRE